MTNRRSLAIWAVTGSLLLILGASVLPIWTVWHFNPMEAVGYHKTLWGAFAELWQRDPAEYYPSFFFVKVTMDARDLVQAGITLAIGACAGMAASALKKPLYLQRNP